MDIKERIDNLTEVEAKAALRYFLELFASRQKTKSEYMAGFQNVHPVEYYEMRCLDKFLDMTRKGETKTEAEKSVHPLPCVRDELGETNEQTIKQLLAKIDEELNELKAGVFAIGNLDDTPNETPTGFFPFIAEEAADAITAITTLLEALGIDAEMRDEAQRRVNEKNRNRNRL